MEENQRIELCPAFRRVAVFETATDHSVLLSVEERRGIELRLATE
jgi:hypothetical protein